MPEISSAQAKQASSKSAADVFGPLEGRALATLEKLVSEGMAFMEPQQARMAAEYILDKLHGKSPDNSQGAEPTWMKIMRKAVHVNGVPVENIPGVSEALSDQGVTASADMEEIVFEFVWPTAS